MYVINDVVDYGSIITATDRTLKIIFSAFATEMKRSIWNVV